MPAQHSTKKPKFVLNKEKPKAPDNLEAVEIGNYSIKLRWNPSADSYQLYGYLLERSDAGKSEWRSVYPNIPVLSDDTTEFEVGDVTPYKVYDFRVKSAIKIKHKAFYSEGCYLDDIAAKKQYQPYPPRNVRVTYINGDSVSLTWLEPIKVKDVSPTSYEYVIEMCPYIDGSILNEWTECYRTTQRECTVEVQHNGYSRFRVSTLNENKNVRSLPQEMGDPELRIHIKQKSPQPGQLERLQARMPVKGVIPTSQEIGSIIHVISCRDMNGLRELWMNYKLGNMEPFFQDLFAFEASLGLDPDNGDKELDIEINVEDFYACHQHLLFTCANAKGFRVVKTENARSRACTPMGLSEEYPVYCKPLVYNTTCSQLDYLDPAMPTNQGASRWLPVPAESLTETTEKPSVTEKRFPGTEERSHGAVERSPGAVERLLGSAERSPGTTERSPGTTERSPGATERSPGTTERSTGATERSTGATERSTRATERSPGATERSPGATERSPGATERSTRATERSTRAMERSPVTTERSPGATERSLGATERSPGTTERSPGTTERSTRATERSPGTTERSPGAISKTEYKTIKNQLESAMHIRVESLQKEVNRLRREANDRHLAVVTKLKSRLASLEHEIAQQQVDLREGMVRSLPREVTRLTQEKETAEKVLLDNRKEIEDLTGANKENMPSSFPSELEEYRDDINHYYKLQVRKQQPVAYDEEFILDVEDTFTTIDILPYNARRQAFDRQPLESIADIFNPTLNPNYLLATPGKVLLWGAPGIGKTTLIAKLLTEWSKRDVKVLQRFDLVFAIALRKVERTQSLVECIFDQLVPESDVCLMKKVIEDYLRRSNRVLFILDGYDELKWQPDEDHDINKLLTRRLFPNASILVTTRPTCTSDVIAKMKPDTRIEILGFSPDNIKRYILKFFGEQPTKGEELLKKISPTLLSTGIFSMPILLLQVCLLWEDDKDVILSDKICPLYNQVVTCLERRYSAKDKNPVHVEDMQTPIHGLEKLAFECLLKEKAVTVFKQEDVFKYCGEHYRILIQLGLLKEQKSPSRINPVAQYSFSHKTMQEYFAAQYLAERLTIEEAAKEEILQHYFPTARKVQTLGEVLIFLCGKLGEKAKFVLHHLLSIHYTSNVLLVKDEFYNFFATGKSRKDWDKDLNLEDIASAEDLTHQFTGQWNNYPHILLTYQSYIVLYLLCCHESGLTAQFAEVFLRNTIQFSGASPRVYGVLSHMIAEESEKIKKMKHLRLVNTQNYVLGPTLEMLDKLSGLTELNLRQSRLGRHLPTCTIPRRLELRFKNRRFMETSEDNLAKAPALLASKLPLLRSLKKLVISWNDLGPEDMKQLLPAMKELRNLEELFLSGNDLGGLGKDIADLVAYLPKLKVFKVYFCQLTFSEIRIIASSLTECCPDLELFDFLLNPIHSDSESIWIGEREIDTVKAALRDKVFVPSGARKLPPTQQGP